MLTQNRESHQTKVSQPRKSHRNRPNRATITNFHNLHVNIMVHSIQNLLRWILLWLCLYLWLQFQLYPSRWPIWFLWRCLPFLLPFLLFNTWLLSSTWTSTSWSLSLCCIYPFKPLCQVYNGIMIWIFVLSPNFWIRFSILVFIKPCFHLWIIFDFWQWKHLPSQQRQEPSIQHHVHPDNQPTPGLFVNPAWLWKHLSMSCTSDKICFRRSGSFYVSKAWQNGQKSVNPMGHP